MSPAPCERIRVGIPGFDEIVHGGLPRGRSTLLAGATGPERRCSVCSFCGAARGWGSPGCW